MLETAHVAAYLLFLAKTYAAFCGNESEILVLQDGKGWYRFPRDPIQAISIEEMESDFRSFNSSLREVQIGLVNFSYPSKQYETALTNFFQKAKDIRTKRAQQVADYNEAYIKWQEEEWENERRAHYEERPDEPRD